MNDVKNKEITGAVLSLRRSAYPLHFSLFFFPSWNILLTADMQLATNIHKPYYCGGIPKHLYT